MVQEAKLALVLWVLFSACLARAENIGYWDIEIPVPESATDIDAAEDRRVMMKTVSFDWKGENVSELRQYYSEFFDSIGWENPLAGSSFSSVKDKSGFSSFVMDFDEYNQPFAKYGSHWKAKDYPAAATLTLHLTEYEAGLLSGKAEVSIIPDLELEASFRLLDLVANDPKNLFRLHNAVQGDPFDIYNVALPANFREESDPLLSEYYQIVDEIFQEFRQWEADYVLD